MPEQKTLFDMNDIAPTKPAGRAKSKKVYAVYQMRGDKKWYFHKSYQDGFKWVRASALENDKRLKPKLMTYRAARMRIKGFSYPYYSKNYDFIGMELWQRE